MHTYLRPARRLALAAWLIALPAAPIVATPALAQDARPAAASAAKAFTRGAPVPAWVERIATLPPAAPGHPFAIRLDDNWYRAGQQLTVYHRHAASAHDPSRLGSLGQFDIDFQPAYQRLLLHRLAVIRDGRVIDKLKSADIRFMQREPGLERAVMNGSVTAQIVTADIRVGDTLDIEFSVVGSNPVFGRRFLQAAVWERTAPVALRRVTVDSAADAPIAHRMLGAADGAAPPARVTLRNGRRLLRLEAADLPAVVGEPWVPGEVQQWRWLQLSDFADWGAVNAWAQELFAVPTAPALLEAPLRAARAAATREEAVARVLEFVQNEIRYLSLSMGENSHRPFAPATVLQRRYGDCKDKTLLAVTMLRALGIDAAPVLLAAFKPDSLDTLLPSPMAFDHAIVLVTVDGKEYFLDPTRSGQYGALDRMGQVHGGRRALVVRPGSTGLSTIPHPAADLLAWKHAERIALPSLDGPASFVARTELAGANAEAWRVHMANTSGAELRRHFEGALTARHPDAHLVGEPRVTDDRRHNLVTIETHYSIGALLSPADGGGYTLPYSPGMLPHVFQAPGTAQRRHPLALPAFPASYEYDLQVTLPPSMAYADAVSEKSVDDPAFRLRRRLALAANTVHLNLKLATLADRVEAQRVPAYLQHVKQYDALLGGGLNVPAPKRQEAAP